ncbi:MAG: hypothetical protein L6277_01425, partial [Desulfobacterales bacterium]|nr:hypothetical protein [Pseudomonadota bacterium]MBU4355157.1 hypothetical protein [Pseudomonadota bacterium]MCG2770735.1 hypothetical protein [Desulfobacterales bacterium]
HPPKSYCCLDPFLNLLFGKVGVALGNFSHDCPLDNFWSSLSYYSLERNLVLGGMRMIPLSENTFGIRYKSTCQAGSG